MVAVGPLEVRMRVVVMMVRACLVWMIVWVFVLAVHVDFHLRLFRRPRLGLVFGRRLLLDLARTGSEADGQSYAQ